MRIRITIWSPQIIRLVPTSICLGIRTTAIRITITIQTIINVQATNIHPVILHRAWIRAFLATITMTLFILVTKMIFKVSRTD